MNPSAMEIEASVSEEREREGQRERENLIARASIWQSSTSVYRLSSWS